MLAGWALFDGAWAAVAAVNGVAGDARNLVSELLLRSLDETARRTRWLVDSADGILDKFAPASARSAVHVMADYVARGDIVKLRPRRRGPLAVAKDLMRSVGLEGEQADEAAAFLVTTLRRAFSESRTEQEFQARLERMSEPLKKLLSGRLAAR